MKIKELTLKQMQLQTNVNALIQSMQAHKIGTDVFEDSLATLMKDYKDEVKINYILQLLIRQLLILLYFRN